jgi:hypothetical protein
MESRLGLRTSLHTLHFANVTLASSSSPARFSNGVVDLIQMVNDLLHAFDACPDSFGLFGFNNTQGIHGLLGVVKATGTNQSDFAQLGIEGLSEVSR